MVSRALYRLAQLRRAVGARVTPSETQAARETLGDRLFPLFESMQIMIGSVHAFTEDAVKGLTANREKAEGWLAKNAIVVTALNPVIGYAQGAALVKEALKKDMAIRDLAIEKVRAGQLKHRDNDDPVSVEEIEHALNDMRRLTESGIA